MNLGFIFALLSLQKLAIGGLPEKILTAFQTVFDDHSNEETAFNMCNTAVHHLSKIGEDVDSASNQGKSLPEGSIFLLSSVISNEACHFVRSVASQIW